MVDYRSFRLNKLNTSEFSHIKLLIFWPVYGIVFFLLEKVLPLNFQDVYCAVDDLIPFCEFFVIPYYLWFAYLIGMLVYLGFVDIQNFRKNMWFIIISYSVTVVCYVLFPSSQGLRPSLEELGRTNIFTQVVRYLYSFDTNTNVCPSIHVIGMMGAFFAGIKTPGMRGLGWKIFWIVSAVLVSFSTVFLKQHSIIDVAAGFALSIVTYFIVYHGSIFKKFKFKTRSN